MKNINEKLYDKLYNKFKESAMSALRWIILLLIIATLFFAFSLLVYFDVITLFEKVFLQLVFAVIVEISVIIGAFSVLIPYLLDYMSIKNDTYTVISAVVSRFDFHWSGYEPMEKIWFPVFMDVNSGKTLKIEIDEKVEEGEKYSIAYLPRTKITVLEKNK